MRKLSLKKRIEGKYFTLKMQIFISLLIIVCSLILGAIYQKRNEIVMKEEFSKTCQTTLKQTSVSLDLIISSIVDVSKQIYGDYEIASIMNKDKIYSYRDFNKINMKAEQLAASNRNISSVYIYLEKSDLVFTSNAGAFELSNFADKSFLDWYKNQDGMVSIMDTHTVQTYDLREKREFLSINIKLPLLLSDKTIKGVLVINLEENLIYEEIINKISENQDIRFFVLSDDNKIIISEEKETLYKDFTQLEYVDNPLDAKSSSFLTKIENDQYLLVYSKENDLNWTFVSLNPYDEIYGTINSINFVIFICVVLIIIFAVSITIIFTSKDLKIVDKITRVISSEGFDDEGSGHSLKDTFDKTKEMVRDNKELHIKLENTMPMYRDRFLFNLVKEDIYEPDKIKESVSEYQIEISEGNLLLAVVEIDEISDELERDISYSGNVTAEIQEILKDVFDKNDIQSFGVKTNVNEITYVVSGKNIEIADFSNIIKSCQNAVLEKGGNTITVGVCDQYYDIYNLNISYNMAKEALKYKILYGKNEIILYSDIQQNSESTYIYPYNKEELLKNFIQTGDAEHAIQILNEIIENIQEDQTYFMVRQLLVQLNSAIIEIINENGIVISEVYGEKNVLEKILQLESIQDTVDYFEKVIVRVIDIINLNKIPKMEKYYKKIEQFINDNYTYDCPIETVSTNIDLSVTYINQILKHYTGKTFVHYINELRIKKACEILKNSDMKIREIAYNVGFSTPQYFIKIFKDITGVTPGKYRDS